MGFRPFALPLPIPLHSFFSIHPSIAPTCRTNGCLQSMSCRASGADPDRGQFGFGASSRLSSRAGWQWTQLLTPSSMPRQSQPHLSIGAFAFASRPFPFILPCISPIHFLIHFFIYFFPPFGFPDSFAFIYFAFINLSIHLSSLSLLLCPAGKVVRRRTTSCRAFGGCAHPCSLAHALQYPSGPRPPTQPQPPRCSALAAAALCNCCSVSTAHIHPIQR